jgi:uncharacterized protein YktB (UPF0637 family)
MTSLGFTTNDFAVFNIDGFSDRMEAIYAHVRPKLLRIGDSLAPELARKLHMEFFAHVAKHRTVNPPAETWCAWGPSPKGYKRYPYLALCISGHGLHARAVVTTEADYRLAMARAIEGHRSDLIKAFKGTGVSRYDKWDWVAMPAQEPASQALWDTLLASLSRKTGTVDVGFGWPLKAALELETSELLDAYGELEPLYRVLQSVIAQRFTALESSE